jgi:hypothetical protein
MSDILFKIPSESPKAWAEFEKFYEDLSGHWAVSLNSIEFMSLPFEMQLGIFLSYFTDNSLDLDIQNTDTDTLKETIYDTFRVHENMMGHYS